MKTEEEIWALKADWQADPIWDIEETEGFEEHKAELKEFREFCEAGWAKAAEYRNARSTKTNVDLAISMIQNANAHGDVWGAATMLQLAQVHATLALVAEMQIYLHTVEEQP